MTCAISLAAWDQFQAAGTGYELLFRIGIPVTVVLHSNLLSREIRMRMREANTTPMRGAVT